MCHDTLTKIYILQFCMTRFPRRLSLLISTKSRRSSSRAKEERSRFLSGVLNSNESQVLEQYISKESAPWSGYQGEEELREKILALSEDRRNFLRAPPQVSSSLEVTRICWCTKSQYRAKYSRGLTLTSSIVQLQLTQLCCLEKILGCER